MLDFPTHFSERIIRFERDCARLAGDDRGRADVVFLGDSLVEFYKGALPWVNRGICSDHLQWPELNVFERLGPDRLHPDPQAIVILVGINDLNDAPDAVDRHADAYGVLLGTLARLYPDARLVVCSLLPTAGPYARLGPRIAELNGRLAEIAATSGAGFLDVHARFVDPSTRMARRGLLVKDGLHLSRRGYAELTALIEDQASHLGVVERDGSDGPVRFRRRTRGAALWYACTELVRTWRRQAP